MPIERIVRRLLQAGQGFDDPAVGTVDDTAVTGRSEPL